MFLHFLFLSVVALSCAFLARVFTAGLDWALSLHSSFPDLIFLLPLVLLVTRRFEGSLRSTVSKSNATEGLTFENLIGFASVPLTWLSHGAGASVGREGVAVQLGRALSSTWGSLSLFQGPWRTEQGLFKCGVASGFAAIFGTPWAAVFFAFELSRIQQTETPRTTAGDGMRQSLPVFAAAFLSDFFATRLFGMSHSVFTVSSFGISWSSFAFVLTVALAAALVGHSHEQMVRGMRHIFCRWEKRHPLLAYGPSVVLMIVLSLPQFVLHRNLGTTWIDGVFNPPMNPWHPTAWEWLLKSFVTALSVAAGFRGGEVTPLFAIGVLLSQPLSFLFQVPSTWAAATGFASVFAVVMRAPWTGVFLSFELFGWESGAGGAVGCGLIALTVHLRKEGGFLSALLQRRQA